MFGKEFREGENHLWSLFKVEKSEFYLHSMELVFHFKE